MPTQKRLRELFDYNERTGHLVWRECYEKRHRGHPAGTLLPNGYVQISVDSKCYPAHRLLWVFHNGPIPSGLVIDHIDRNRSNNCIENLRLATIAENCRNTIRTLRNPSGVCGVVMGKGKKKWRAQIKVGQKMVHIGSFATKEEAKEARGWGEELYRKPAVQLEAA